jgi:hypothetical protein
MNEMMRGPYSAKLVLPSYQAGLFKHERKKETRNASVPFKTENLRTFTLDSTKKIHSLFSNNSKIVYGHS